MLTRAAAAGAGAGPGLGAAADPGPGLGAGAGEVPAGPGLGAAAGEVATGPLADDPVSCTATIQSSANTIRHSDNQTFRHSCQPAHHPTSHCLAAAAA
jgi:hypothetical protein